MSKYGSEKSPYLGTFQVEKRPRKKQVLRRAKNSISKAHFQEK